MTTQHEDDLRPFTTIGRPRHRRSARGTERESSPAEAIADHTARHEYAFHSDGEPCLVAMTTANCPMGHHYGRTFGEAL